MRWIGSPSSRLILLLPLILVLGFTPVLVGQSVGRVEQTTSTSNAFYVYTKPGDLTIQVFVLGTVRYPGLYEVSTETDMQQLLALSGGPQFRERQSFVKRKTLLRLYRREADLAQNNGSTADLSGVDLMRSPDPIFETDLARTFTDQGIYPDLKEGDVITLDVVGSPGLNWRDTFPIISAVGTIAIAFWRFTN